jgi:hypothetical protein
MMDEISGNFYRTVKTLLYTMYISGMAIMIFRIIQTTFLSK